MSLSSVSELAADRPIGLARKPNALGQITVLR